MAQINNRRSSSTLTQVGTVSKWPSSRASRCNMEFGRIVTLQFCMCNWVILCTSVLSGTVLCAQEKKSWDLYWHRRLKCPTIHLRRCRLQRLHYHRLLTISWLYHRQHHRLLLTFPSECHIYTHFANAFATHHVPPQSLSNRAWTWHWPASVLCSVSDSGAMSAAENTACKACPYPWNTDFPISKVYTGGGKGIFSSLLSTNGISPLLKCLNY